MIKAMTPWPFSPDQVVAEILPQTGDDHEVWFMNPATVVDTPDGEKMRVHSIAFDYLVWWAPVESVRIISEEQPALVDAPETPEPEDGEVDVPARTESSPVLDGMTPLDQRTSLAVEE